MFEKPRACSAYDLLVARDRREDLDIDAACCVTPKGGELFHELERSGATEQARLRVMRSQLIEQHFPEDLASNRVAGVGLHCALDWSRCHGRALDIG